ncbi:RNA-binding ATPase activator esf2 [Coemansia brasiliensis]|uniref:18S rRNA factor 2 n=1 Tax=Coemansia brasiliensis TaxID=2650707 RepID=A0A9W8IEK7_9FUNG|nr:RNA-binding ATPase activator esf2 [Coemansia brasiliensis]
MESGSNSEYSSGSEVEEQSRSSMIRQRNTHDSSSEGESVASDNEHSQTESRSEDEEPHKEESDDEDYFVGDMAGEPTEQPKKLLSAKDVERAQKTERKSGVVYMSRVPPYMKPIQVRHMLEKYAQIGRIYLVEEDEQKRKQRKKTGGNKRRQYEEGWIEFKNKKYAKAVATMLNNTKMGGKRHSFYHDDLWNLRYLPKFKWRHLVEQLANERAAKEQRLQTEISQSRRELDAYVKSVERAKKMNNIRAKRQAKIDRGEEVKQLDDRSRNVWQRDVVVRDASASDKPDSKRRRVQGNMDSVLSKIF